MWGVIEVWLVYDHLRAGGAGVCSRRRGGAAARGPQALPPPRPLQCDHAGSCAAHAQLPCMDPEACGRSSGQAGRRHGDRVRLTCRALSFGDLQLACSWRVIAGEDSGMVTAQWRTPTKANEPGQRGCSVSLRVGRLGVF